MPTVVSVDVIDLDHEEDVFDIQIEDDESFIVHDAVVHNSGICKSYHRKIWTVPGYEPVDHSLPYAGGTPRHWRCRSSILPIILPFDRLSPRHQARIALQQRQAAFTGASPADLEFEDWLRTQTPARQKAALGGRHGLWKAGTLSVEDMLDPTFNPVSIRELRKILGLD